MDPTGLKDDTVEHFDVIPFNELLLMHQYGQRKTINHFNLQALKT